MSLSNPQRLGIGLVLAAVMLLTRVNHFGVVPDASWAVFFLGGFYLRRDWKWAFPLGMVLAVLADWYVIAGSGGQFWSHYCVSAAYWFLVPAHAALWFAGSTLARAYRGLEWRAAPWLLATFLVGVSACYTISNGSFFWLGNGAWVKSLDGWFKNFGDWYGAYLYTAAIYVAIAAAVHVVVAALAPKASVADVPAPR
jgi:hypothetical protein